MSNDSTAPTHGRDEHPAPPPPSPKTTYYSLECSWYHEEASDCTRLRGPDWATIEWALSGIKTTPAHIRLKLYREGSEVDTLEVDAEAGAFLLTRLLPDNELKSFSDPNASPEHVEIGGNYWDGRMVCRHHATVVRAFAEFFTTGTVSEDILN